MKILVIHEISYFEGPVFEFQEFAEGFASKGHEVVVLDLLEKKSSYSRAKRRTKGGRIGTGSVKVISPGPRIQNDLFRPIGVIAHLFSLTRLFIRFRPDIVFSYSVPTSGVTTAILGKVFRVPVIHRSIDVSHRLRPNIYTPFVRVAESLTFRLSSLISTHNKALGSYVIAHGAKEKGVFVHYPPVNVEYFSKPQLKSNDGIVKIIFVGTLFESSGLIDFLRSIPNAELGDNWHLRIVGDGIQRLDLEELVIGLSLQHKVDFRGWVEYDHLADELSWANVAIVPFEKNLLTDSALPQKTIQYLASGLPVVSTSLEGSVAELADCPGVTFVDSPKNVFEQALNMDAINPRDNGFLESRFGYSATIDNMLDFLGTAVQNHYSQRNSSTRYQERLEK